MFFNIKFSLVLFLSAFCFNIGTSQVLKGKVFEKGTGEAMVHVQIRLLDGLKLKESTYTNLDGEYVLEIKKKRKYTVICSWESYINDTITLDVLSNETLYHNFYLERDSSYMWGCPIIITEKPYQSGDLTMTQNQYKVMPASFQDPARILIKYPGFSTPNDGANAIIFRGMPPESARFQLFGADIVNPNHLSNAGTANDLATGNAGGVNALSGSVLDYYHFEANPADVSYADVMSGVSNMKMAPKINSFVDLNLIGLEAGLGMSRGNKNVYASYRYSFVGLLDNLGVNFGNEKIGYQDLSVYADLIKINHNSLKIFATLGNSSNIFSAVSRGDSLTRFKDIQNITYKSEMAMSGVQYTYEKAKQYFQSTLVVSGRNDRRDESTDAFYADSLGMTLSSNQKISEKLLSWHNQYVLDYSSSKMTFGLRTNLKDDGRIVNGVDEPILSIYPYIQYKSDPYKTFQYHVGLGSFYDSRTKEITAEPSAGVKYNVSNNTSINFDYRLSSFQDFTIGNFSEQVYDRKRIKAHNLQTGIQFTRNYLQLRGAVFLHQFWDISTFRPDMRSFVGHFTPFNGCNLGYDQIFGMLNIIPNGTSDAKVYGSELYFENASYLKGNALYYGVNFSIFDSKYTLNDDTDNQFDGRYNFGYTSNVNISYTMDVSKSGKDRNLIFSISNHFRGALREQSLNQVNENATTLYDTHSSYDQTFKPYQRLDFRVVYNKQKSGGRKKHRWSLDIQNLLNRENDGFRYYDALLDKTMIQKQLGLVPVLSYRLEW